MTMADIAPRDGEAVRRLLGILTAGELAAAFELTADTLQDWRQRRCGPVHLRLGKGVFYAVDDVKQWMTVHRRSDVPEPA
jgi:hypothetical protein